MQRSTWSRLALLGAFLTAVAVGCGGSADDREEIRAQYGEPDNTLNAPGPTTDLEVWIYTDFQGSGTSYCYQFEHSRSACGGDDRWYLSAEGTGLCNLYFENPVSGTTEGTPSMRPGTDGKRP